MSTTCVEFSADLDEAKGMSRAQLEQRYALAKMAARLSTRLALAKAEGLEKELEETSAERDGLRELAILGADTIIAMCEEDQDAVVVPRRIALLAQYHLGNVFNVEAQDLAGAIGELLGSYEAEGGAV